MSENSCNDNWHVFDKGVDIFIAGSVCKCGKKVTTDEIGVLKDVKDEKEN